MKTTTEDSQASKALARLQGGQYVTAYIYQVDRNIYEVELEHAQGVEMLALCGLTFVRSRIGSGSQLLQWLNSVKRKLETVSTELVYNSFDGTQPFFN